MNKLMFFFFFSNRQVPDLYPCWSVDTLPWSSWFYLITIHMKGGGETFNTDVFSANAVLRQDSADKECYTANWRPLKRCLEKRAWGTHEIYLCVCWRHWLRLGRQGWMKAEHGSKPSKWDRGLHETTSRGLPLTPLLNANCLSLNSSNESHSNSNILYI